MKQIRILAGVLFLLTATQAMATSSDIDRRKGLGYSAVIGGPAGITLNFGVGNFIIEALIGVSRYTDGDPDVDPITFVDAALGTHLQMLRSKRAALTIGARFNLGTGSVLTDPDAPGGARTPVTQIGFDVPLRIYWFPDRHISIHTEFGVSVLLGPSDAILYEESRNREPTLSKDGYSLHLFRDDAPVGQLGLTFWW